MEFAKLRAFRAHVRTCVPALNYYLPMCLNALIFHLSTCLSACVPINVRPTCTHISRTYVPITTQDIETDIYPTDVKSDQN